MLPIALWSAVGVLLLATLLLFTTYAKRVPVTGRVIYTPSAAEAVFNHDGIIGRIEVHQGKGLRKGCHRDVFTRCRLCRGGMNQALQDAAQRQLTELQKRAGERRKEGEEERLRLREKVSAKEREMVAIQAAAEAESEHIVGLKKRMALYQQLLLKGITTVQEKIERENEYHNSIAQLNTHRINIARVKGELLQFEDELARSESQEKQSITDIQQQKVTLQQQVINASAVVESRVVAPLDGVVASMSILEGQRVTAGAVAAVVVPENARPFVEMWIRPLRCRR